MNRNNAVLHSSQSNSSLIGQVVNQNSQLFENIKLNKISYLNFAWVFLGDKEVFKKLTDLLKVNTSVEKINFRKNNLDFECLKTLCDYLKDSKTIKSLSLRENFLDNYSMNLLKDLLIRNKSIKELDIGDNYIGDAGLVSLSEGLSVNSTLTKLEFYNNQFGYEGFSAFCTILKYHTTLTSLNISKSDIDVRGYEVLGISLKLNQCLEELNLSNSTIVPPKFQKFCEGFKMNCALQKLNLAKNNLGLEGIKILCESLQTNNSLQILNLENCYMESECGFLLGETLKKNNSLKTLILSENFLEDIGTESIFKALIINRSLQILNIEKNHFGDAVVPSLCKVLETNNVLLDLNVYENKFSFAKVEEINEKLKSNHTIQKIDLGSVFGTISKLDALKNYSVILSQIEDTLLLNSKRILQLEASNVDWSLILTNYKGIKILRINNCNLHVIPNEINILDELVTLDLQYNKLTEIPRLSQLTNLISLNLSNNLISIPKENELFYLLSSRLPFSLNNLVLVGNKGYSKAINPHLSASLLSIILNKRLWESNSLPLTNFFFWWASKNLHTINLERLIEFSKIVKCEKHVDLSSRNLTSLPAEAQISALENLCTHLVLIDNKFSQFPEAILSLTQLKVLRLRKNNFSVLPSSISVLTNLKEISLESNNFSAFPTALSQLKSLERIWIEKNSISNIPTNIKFSNLQRISLSQNKLTGFEGIIEWSSLQMLFLNENNLETIPKEIKNLSQLKKLFLNKNKISSIPFEIGELKALIDLQIRENLIEEIPVSIGELIQLESLDLSNNQIKILPPSMGLLTRLTSLNIRKNPIVSPPIQFTNNLNDLKGYFRDLLMGEQKCNYLKLIIIGEENVGKTTLVRTLNAYNNSSLLSKKANVKQEFKNTPISTDGIEISVQPLVLNIEKAYSLPNNQLIFNLWDFGGQEVYHSTHIFFLSPNSIYLIVWNMNKKDEVDRLIYWIQTIKTYIKKPMIILVGTHLDCIDKSIKLEEIYENISTKTKILREYIIGVSCKKGSNYDKLIDLIKYQAFGYEGNKTLLPSDNEKNVLRLVGQIFPQMYFNLKDLIDKEGTKRIENKLAPILEFNEFQLISQKINIVGEELKRGLFFLHCLGFCLYFLKDNELNKYVILNSQWLADTMATLITTRGRFVQNGLLDHRHFKQVWRAPKYPEKIHPVLYELLQKFEVLIPITHDIEGDIYSGKSVVPALLSTESKPKNVLTNWNEGARVQLQRIYSFSSFLPSQIFPQFMATIFSFFGLNDVEYWRDGILIKRNKIKCLIEQDLLNRYIIISFVGNDFISLFKQIQIRLEMVLNRWENLNLEIYLTCSSCASSLTSNRNKCFKLKNCFESYSRNNFALFCPYSSDQNKKSEFVKNLIPELNYQQIKSIEWSEIELGTKIGEGSFAEVFKGKYETVNVAIKKLRTGIQMDDSSNTINEESIREFLLEIQFLSFIRHNNILQFVGVVLSPPCIILPFATHGSLFRFLEKSEDLNLEMILRIGLDISLGLNYLHSLNSPIIHCDLKSENVLVMSTDYRDPDSVCKITDFGLSRFSVGKFLVNKNLNPRWAAPEVIANKDQSPASDIYSFGIILYELLTRDTPYSSKQNPDWKFSHIIANSVMEGVRPTYSKLNIKNKFNLDAPNQIYETMELCWSQQPGNRPNAKAIVKIFYTFLSHYWEDIENHIPSPLQTLNSPTFTQPESLDQSKVESLASFVQFKNATVIQKSELILQDMVSSQYLCTIKNLSDKYLLKERRTDIPNDKAEDVKKIFEQELSILKTISSRGSHPNLIQFIGYYQNLWIILEYCNGGTLEQYLKNCNDFLSILELKLYCKSILLGLKFLHENKYAHLNLSCNNILLKKEDSQISSLCLSNFGALHINFKPKDSYPYISPEVVSESSYDESKADIWSFGMVLFRMLGEEFPSDSLFHSVTLSFKANRNWDSLAPFPQIHSKCTQQSPQLRPSISDILSWI